MCARSRHFPLLRIHAGNSESFYSTPNVFYGGQSLGFDNGVDFEFYGVILNELSV